MVFHCEFSSERGPRVYKLFRSMDRKKNIYPELDWPEIYLLKDGYKRFWEELKDDSKAHLLFGVNAYKPMLGDTKELHQVSFAALKVLNSYSRFANYEQKQKLLLVSFHRQRKPEALTIISVHNFKVNQNTNNVDQRSFCVSKNAESKNNLNKTREYASRTSRVCKIYLALKTSLYKAIKIKIVLLFIASSICRLVMSL